MQNLYKNINRNDLVQSILALGNEISFLVEDHIGSSKSSLIHDISAALPTAVSADPRMPGISELQASCSGVATRNA